MNTHCSPTCQCASSFPLRRLCPEDEENVYCRHFIRTSKMKIEAPVPLMIMMITMEMIIMLTLIMIILIMYGLVDV